MYSPDIPVGSADFTLIIPGNGTHSYTVSYPWEECSAFSAAVAIRTVLIFIPPGTHYCWVDRGGESKLAQSFYTWILNEQQENGCYTSWLREPSPECFRTIEIILYCFIDDWVQLTCSSSILDCRSTGQVISPAPGAYMIQTKICRISPHCAQPYNAELWPKTLFIYLFHHWPSFFPPWYVLIGMQLMLFPPCIWLVILWHKQFIVSLTINFFVLLFEGMYWGQIHVYHFDIHNLCGFLFISIISAFWFGTWKWANGLSYIIPFQPVTLWHEPSKHYESCSPESTILRFAYKYGRAK